MALASRLISKPPVVTAVPELVESAPQKKKKRRRRYRRLLPPVAMFVVVVGAWQLISSSLSNGRQFLLPRPLDVLTVGFFDRASADTIFPALGRTAILAAVGLVIAIVIGMLLGTVLYRLRWLERASYPYLVALQATPILAVSTLLAVAFGYSFFTKEIIVVMIAFFPIPTSFLLGLKSADRDLMDLFHLHRAGWWTSFWKLALPNSLPQLFTGFRISAGLAVIGAIVGEQFFQAGSPGLGMTFLRYLQYVEYDQVYACLILSSLLGVSFYLFFTVLSRRLFGGWHASGEHDRN